MQQHSQLCDLLRQSGDVEVTSSAVGSVETDCVFTNISRLREHKRKNRSIKLQFSFFSVLPGFSLDAGAWPGPAGRPAGCAPGRSSGRPRCSAVAGGGGSPPSPEPRGPAWSTAGGRVKTAHDPEAQTRQEDKS